MDIAWYNREIDMAINHHRFLLRSKRSLLRNSPLLDRLIRDSENSLIRLCRGRNNYILNYRSYWNVGQRVGPPTRYFTMIEYLPLETSRPDLDIALHGALTDCGQDVKRILDEFTCAKVWMSVLVVYEPANIRDDKREEFQQYLSSAPTRLSKLDGPVTGFKNPYIQSVKVLTERIKQHNAKFIRDKSGLRLKDILKLTLKISQYAPLRGGCNRELPMFLQVIYFLI